MNQEQRTRIIAESPVHGPALLAELDGLRGALETVANGKISEAHAGRGYESFMMRVIAKDALEAIK